MKVLITAPSLDETLNVSGISTIVRQIIEHGESEFSHFEAGRPDGEKIGPKWLAKQTALPVRFAGRVTGFRPDVVHINTALTDLSIARDAVLAAIARGMGKRVVLAVHGGKYLIDDCTNGTIKSLMGNMLTRSDSVVVYSEYEKALLEKRWKELKIHTLPNAIPADKVAVRTRSNAEPVIVYFGRMHESKGLHELIDAARVLAESGFKFKLKAYGEGPIREFFVNGMRDVLGTRFEYGGIVRGDDKWAILGAADIFVLPSRYGEGMPMAILEAMATGCIVIAADVASVATVLRDGTNGFLVKPYDAAGLASKIKVVLSDKLSWPELRENAAATMRNDYAIAGYIQKLEEIYRKAFNA